MSMELMLKSVYENNKGFEREELGKIINAMRIVDRKFFVPAALSSDCYSDSALPIGKGQTISQPSTAAAMLLYAELAQGMDVLEVGAGSGWNACLIQYLVHPGRVIAVDRIDYIAENAKNNLSKFRKHLKKSSPKEIIKFSNLAIGAEDALDEKSEIWNRKYDRIVITAGVPVGANIDKNIRKMADTLLKAKGILVCPQESGALKIYRKGKELKIAETKEEYNFVPLLRGKE